MSPAVAFRAFFAALFNARRAELIRAALEAPLPADDSPGGAAVTGPPQPRVDQSKDAAQRPAAVSKRPAVPASRRSEAITLLATLQREARLVDLIQEPLDQYSDAQVGAAARPCLTQCRATLQRIFDLQPLVDSPEGAAIEVPPGASPLRFQWVGDASQAGTRGRLVHPGWQAARCELAVWTGEDAEAKTIAPAQLEP